MSQDRNLAATVGLPPDEFGATSGAPPRPKSLAAAVGLDAGELPRSERAHAPRMVVARRRLREAARVRASAEVLSRAAEAFYGAAQPPESFVSTARRIMREGEYGKGSGTLVYYQDENTLQDAADLWAVLEELDPASGSANVDNTIAYSLLETLQQGRLLSEGQLAYLRELLDRYATQIEAYRAAGRPTQDLLQEPGSDGRVREEE